MCSTAAGIVFLDLRSNRYQALTARYSDALQTLLDPYHEGRSALADRLGSTLERAGLLERTRSGVASSHTCTPIARISAAELIDPEQTAHPHPVRFLTAYIWARRAIRGRSFWSIIEELADERAPPQTDACDDRMTPVVRAALHALAFHRLRPFAFTSRDQCLLHALALLHYLRSQHIHATWFIGVNTQPWRAHSWVQYGDVVLDGTPEQVLEFTPILVV
jgi:hypothetical protein